VDRFAYILRRLAQVVPVAIGVTMLTFLLVHLLPGDPAGAVLGNRATPQLVAQLHAKWGLDRSLPEQYWLFVQRLAHGDLGDSLLYGDSVRSMVVQRTPVTLWLLVYSTILAMLIAVPLATFGARRKDGAVDQVVRAVPIVGLGMPAFWLGIMLIILFAAGDVWRVFPVSGYGDGFFGHLESMFLPALTVAIGTMPLLIRSLRASLLGVLESDYITTARAKGLPERRVLLRHALRNGIMPMITVLGINLGFLIGNTVVVEKVFALPGVGAMIYDGINQRDFAVVQGVTLILATLVVLVNITIDLAYAMLDPRVRFD
jgi:peptide/nickel transport system permease protein